MDKKKLIFGSSILIGIIAMVIMYISIDDILTLIVSVPLLLLLPYAFIVLTIHVLHVFRWRLILITMGHKIPFLKLFSFRLMGFSLNYITPTAHIGGEPLKAAMLKENNVPYTKGVSSILIAKSFEVTADGLFGIAGVIILGMSYALPEDSIKYIIILTLFCLFAVIGIFFKVMKKDNPFMTVTNKISYFIEKTGFKPKIINLVVEKIQETSQNIKKFFTKNKKEFKISLFISFVMWIVMFIEYKILLLMLGFNASIYQLFIIISFVGLAYFIPIPAALGVLEAGQVSAFSILKLPTSFGIATSLIIRAKDILITIIGLLLIFIKGIRFK